MHPIAGPRYPKIAVPSPTGDTSNTTAWMAKVLEVWHAVQLPHYGGKYSIERMLSLEEYTRTTSLSRVLLVIVRLPLIVLAMVLSQEAIPLQDPREGWQANYGFWARMGFFGIASSYDATSQIGPWLNGSPLSLRQTLVTCICSCVVFIILGMVGSALWVFPVPFCSLTVSMISSLVLCLVVRAVLGPDAWKRIASQTQNWHHSSKVLAMNGVICVGYPAYQALFTKANHTPYELPVLLLLPVIKITMKFIFRYIAFHKEDMIPETVVFTVNFFDMLYLATFMQTVSTATMALIMTCDCAHSILSLISLHQRTQNISDSLKEILGSDNPTSDSFELLHSARILCNRPHIFCKQIRPYIRVRGSIFHRVSDEGRALLEALEKYLLHSSLYQQHPVLLLHPLPHGNNGTAWNKRKTTVSVEPQESRTVKLTYVNTVGLATESVPENGGRVGQAHGSALHQALQSLFTSECLVLVEYVEFVIPLMYAVYVLTMVYLPSAKYHSEMAEVTANNAGSAVSRIVVYALLELASFIALAVITQRHCGIRTLYQLSFVLETHSSLVVSRVILWMLVTLTYRVEHFGKPCYDVKDPWKCIC
ncbi:unnamed protein product [Phytophthora fragariaefolia]|uniref:Unnamed protein product n=1 Tax=Phytophthora fragariaefolia TaxID=1490495 RepID=A0A9W6WTL1_9STRA|nr:unnamed protein product [Phytophthora fragariaefolia]